LYIIRGVEISKEARSNLLAEFPFMDIQERGPARLGIMSRNDQRDLGCVISDIDPESAAEAAGLRPLDQILEIAGEPVETFDTLIKIIEKKEPGDRVAITYRRGGEKLQTIAELSPWKPSGSARPKRETPRVPENQK
jgi:S1-C subfamily serine protease